jgi:Rad3-related DNA helicase
LVKYIKTLENLISSRFASDATGAGEHSKQYEMLDKHICKINRFIEVYSEENWVMNLVHPGPSNKRAGLKFEFKPVDVARYSHEHLFRFGGHVLLMSATVVDKDTFCRSVGIDTNEVAFLNIPSPFSSENRPIHFISAGSMSKDNIASTLPAIAEAVKMILDQHPSDKGIIHCTNYKVAQYIKENVKSPRLLSHTSENRDSVLKSHMATTAPTVLLSPSMMEGVDLADDASRFQILCKVPFPYLGDEVVKKRMSRDRSWYTYQTVKSIVQSMGRSIRNETDHAVSYILDADWERFYNMNKKMFPEEFTKALVR